METTQQTADAPSVCLIGPLPPPAGGMANQCDQLARLLRSDGILVSVVRTNAPYWPHWVAGIPMLRAACRLLPYVFRLWKAIGRARVVHVFANSGWAWHLFAAPAIWVGRLRGARVIVNYRGGGAKDFFARCSPLVHATLRMASERVTPSTFLQRVFDQYGMKVEIVPNVVDLSRFKYVPRPINSGSPHLIVTRHLETIYDNPTAIRAFAEVRKVLPAARLTVAGVGPELEGLQRLVAQLDLKDCVCFAGHIDNAGIAELYASADCMLNPSTVDNMPVSILEAFASGVPVVSTNAGGIPDMVRDRVSALLVPVCDHVRMAQEAIRVLTDPQLAMSLRDAGMRTARNHEWPHIREHWLRIYRGAPDGREERLC